MHPSVYLKILNFMSVENTSVLKIEISSSKVFQMLLANKEQKWIVYTISQRVSMLGSLKLQGMTTWQTSKTYVEIKSFRPDLVLMP